jgi:DNA-directed RNA polymerase specialized sigma24 family protein
MEREESFDAFYRDTRRRLLHQTFALTGDQRAAGAAVRDAYVAAWHHWRKVEPLEDRLDWVRPLSWQLAQRRHAGRIWHRNKGLDDAQRATLDALGTLSTARRRVLLLVDLAGVPLATAARELALTRDVAQRHLAEARLALQQELATDSAGVIAALAGLDAALEDVPLPRASIVRRAGRKRRQVHTLVAVAAAVVLTVGSGAVAYQPPPGQDRSEALEQVLPQEPAPEEAEQLPSADNLLDRDQISRLALDRDWKVVRTHSNTDGDGLNTICQQERFADPDGLSALVRVFKADGKKERRAVQTVEVSADEDEAHRAYRTTLGWYAECQVGRLQLLRAYRVGNIGAEADMLVLRRWKRPVTTYTVALARVGTVVTSTVGQTEGGAPTPPKQVAQSLADSVAMLCARSGATDCSNEPSTRQVPPPPSGTAPGMLAPVDLPPVGGIRFPWVGTKVPSRPNPSVTTCDRAAFRPAGARRAKAWTYVIPEAKVPARFGLSETVGEFGSKRRAERFMSDVRSRFARCEDRDLATDVIFADRGRVPRSRTFWSTWTFVTEVNERMSVRFRVGFVRKGDKVAQLTFVSSPRDDIRPVHFRDLVVRAGDRLGEL